MRKIFEDLSLTEGVLIFFSVVLGIFLRLYDLSLISHWSDELATLFFAKYPHRIFLEELHTPGFYLLSKIIITFFDESIGALRTFVALMSISFCLYLSFYARDIFERTGWIVFTIALFLLPVDIAFARMARMYSPVFMLSLWFYLIIMKENHSNKTLFSVSLLMTSIFPLCALPGGCLIISNVIRDKKWSREDSWLFASLVPIISYYLTRFFYTGPDYFIGNYLSGEKNRTLLKDFFLTISGDHYPKTTFYRVSDLTFYFLILVSGLIVLGMFNLAVKSLKKRKIVFYHLTLVVISIASVQAFSTLVINIKVGRYLIFLFPLFLIYLGLLGTYNRKFKYQFLAPLTFFSLLLHLYFFSPVKFYPWERESFAHFNKLLSRLPEANFVFCGNKYQYDFYFDSPHKHCALEYEKLKKEKENFVFIDMNGFMSDYVDIIAKNYVIRDFKVVGGAMMFTAYYKLSTPSEENEN